MHCSMRRRRTSQIGYKNFKWHFINKFFYKLLKTWILPRSLRAWVHHQMLYITFFAQFCTISQVFHQCETYTTICSSFISFILSLHFQVFKKIVVHSMWPDFWPRKSYLRDLNSYKSNFGNFGNFHQFLEVWKFRAICQFW